MTLGMIVRCDSGGLASQTWECWRHLKPDRTMAVLMDGDARGPESIDRYASAPGLSIAHRRIEPHVLAAFASECDAVFVIESPYCAHGLNVIRAAGARAILLANPELFNTEEHGTPDQLYVPTDWLTTLNGGHEATVLSQPVALDRFAGRARVRRECRSFYVPAAPAMLDRNGTQVVLDALAYVTQPCTVTFRGPDPLVEPNHEHHMGPVAYTWLDAMPVDYWDAYPDADAMVLPRRYGGLCLSVMEAAALGMPTLMTAVRPQCSWGSVVPIPVSERTTFPMKGGTFHVWQPDPRVVAQTMDDCVRSTCWDERSEAALMWAADNSWGALLPRWEECLRG